MTTQKDTPVNRQLSMADLENLTGITFKPIKKRLEGLEPVKIQGVKKIYDTKEARKLNLRCVKFFLYLRSQILAVLQNAVTILLPSGLKEAEET